MPPRTQVLTLLQNGTGVGRASQEFAECVDTIAGELRTDSSYEQSQVWPRLADALSGDVPADLARRWQTARAGAASKPHPHVPAEPRVLGTLTPLLSISDRLIDTLRRRVCLQP